VSSDIWSATSYKSLYLDAIETDRVNRLHPGEAKQKSYVEQCFEGAPGVFVAASDYVKALPESIAKWIPGRLQALGTDGFGRSETRDALRNFFEVDHRFIVLATLNALLDEKKIKADVVKQAMAEFGIAADKPNPFVS
jgi:pyruvate dehydrogenase E1 component